MDALTRRILAAARSGRVLDLGGGSAFDRDASAVTRYDVPAATLLAVLTGGTTPKVDPRGVRLRGARLVGTVDWDWQELDAPLELTDTVVEEQFQVSHTAVAGLSFHGCVLRGFTGRRMVSRSHLDFSRSRIDGTIDVRGADIAGAFVATGATIKSGDDDTAVYAARLRTGAGVVMDGGFSAAGSVMLRSATVGGAFFGEDGRFANPGGEALHLDNIEVRGGMFLTNGFAATGRVRMPGARITGSLDCGGGSFSDPDGEDALWLSGVSVSGSVYLRFGFSCVGRLRMNGARIEGALDLREGSFRGSTHSAIMAMNLDAHGDVYFPAAEGRPRTTIDGRIVLIGSQIRGSLNLNGTRVTNAGGVAIDAPAVRIGGNLRLGDGFESTGEAHFGGIQVGGYLSCNGGTFRNPGRWALDLINAEINGSARLQTGCVVEGGVRLQQAQFGSVLDLTGVRIENRGSQGLFAPSIQVAGTMWLAQTAMVGSVHLDSARIEGDLDLAGASIAGNDLAFDGEGMFVGGSFRWRDMPAPPSGGVDWRRASVGELDDQEGSWPADGMLQLSGFHYARLSDQAPRTPARRIDWIRKQAGYAPEPYQQLAELYRRNGQVAEATVVAMAQQDDLVLLGDLTRPARFWKRFLGLTIGHGYRPGRAAWLLIFLYLITAGTIWIGAQNDAFIQVGETAPQPGVTSSRCTDAYPCFSVEAYALENITPFINLHQSENWHPKSSTPLELALRDWLYLCTVAGYAGTTLLAAGLSGLARNT